VVVPLQKLADGGAVRLQVVDGVIERDGRIFAAGSSEHLGPPACLIVGGRGTEEADQHR
jgi:hypothetical protein